MPVVERLEAVCRVELGTQCRQLARQVLAGTVRWIPRSGRLLRNAQSDRLHVVAARTFDGDGNVSVRLIIIASTDLEPQSISRLEF